MIEKGGKLKHVKSPTFVNEMVDSFNITAIHTGSGPKVMISAGRDSIDVIQETFVEKDGALVTEAQEGDSILVRYAVANLTVPLESARSLAAVLQETIEKYDSAMAQHLQGQGQQR